MIWSDGSQKRAAGRGHQNISDVCQIREGIARVGVELTEKGIRKCRLGGNIGKIMGEEMKSWKLNRL
jgi:hypothetical protein